MESSQASETHEDLPLEKSVEPMVRSTKYSLCERPKPTSCSSRPTRKASANISYANPYLTLDLPPSPHKEWKYTPHEKGPSQQCIAASKAVTKPPLTRHPINVVKTRKVETEQDNPDPTVDSDATEIYDAPATQKPAEEKAKTVAQTSKKHVFISKTVGLVKHKCNRVFKCNKCDCRFPTMCELNAHYKENHDPVKCYVCHKVFNTQSSLDRHLYSHEIATKKCRCGNLFRFDSELESHKLTHQ